MTTAKIYCGKQWLHRRHLAECAGISDYNVVNRLNKYGFTPAETFVIPVLERRKTYYKNHTKKDLRQAFKILFQKALHTPSEFYGELGRSIAPPWYKVAQPKNPMCTEI